MAFPDNLGDVDCVGFDRLVLPYLVTALADKRVKWLDHKMFASHTVADFEYLGFIYRLEEHFELVTRIKKIGQMQIADDDGNEMAVFSPDRALPEAVVALEEAQGWGTW
jgi:hypothetical protein